MEWKGKEEEEEEDAHSIALMCKRACEQHNHYNCQIFTACSKEEEGLARPNKKYGLACHDLRKLSYTFIELKAGSR